MPYGAEKILLVTFMTMAANLGSMFTPIGNPQNLYLYSLSGLSLLHFLLMMLPYTLGAAVLFLICIFLFFSGKKISGYAETLSCPAWHLVFPLSSCSPRKVSSPSVSPPAFQDMAEILRLEP